MMPAVSSVAPATELLNEPTVGRRFSISGRVRLGDVDRSGRMRLDAIARVLQDVATDDASDAGLDRRFGWLVRRTLIDSPSPASLGESYEATTWCTGIGRSWAERRTRVLGDRGAIVEAVSLWVQVDVVTGRPTRIASDFVDAYGEAADGRVVTSRLTLPGVPDGRGPGDLWAVRRTDLDPFGHVNNAATWAFLEEVAALDESDRVGRAEIEYLRPVERERDVGVVVGDLGT
jgi:acyl-ACP thioesterase